MAEIDSGSLHFTSTMDNDQINGAVDETLRRVQGLSDGTVSGGKRMDAAFDATAQSIRAALGQIGAACETHETALQELEAKYQELGQKAGVAFMAGRDDEVRAIQEQQAAVKGEISVRQQLLDELHSQSNALEEAAAKQEENRVKTAENEQTQMSMRARIRELKEEMMMLADQGIDQNSEAYKRLVDELGRLQDIQGDVATQGRALANDQATFQGVISGLQGVAGGFSAATGAVSLFAGENENLQKVMTKVQSVMAITMGVQQVSEMLNKDSAFSLITLTKLKGWWADCVAKAAATETAETAATVANTAAQGANATATGAATTAQAANTVANGAQAVSAQAGTVANLGLAGSFRLIGVAIKSIPVFGWILAGISGLIALYVSFSSKTREAKKAQEEFTKAMVDGCYKPIGTIQQLSQEYTALGNNIKAKEKFIEDNKKKFDELGVSVNNLTQAENLLIANKDRFVLAQIAKAKALVYTQQATEKIKKLMELQSEADAMPDKKTTFVQTGSGMYGGVTGTYVTGENQEKKKKKKEIEDLTAEIKNGYNNAYIEEKNAAFNLRKGGIESINTYADGTVGAIKQAIAKKQEALDGLKPNSKEWKQTYDDIAKLQKQIANPTSGGGGGSNKPDKSDSGKDPFKEKLESYKKEYERFNSWANASDATIQQAAKKEFDGLLKEGATYIDYLKNQRDIILSVDVANRTKAQNEQLRTLNDSIAEETKQTVLEAFNTELSDALANAKTAVEMLSIIEEKRKTLANDGTEVDKAENDSLDDAEKSAKEKQEEETEALLENYTSYLDKKIKMEQQYNDDVLLLEKARDKATTDAERDRIARSIQERKNAFAKDSTDLSFEQLKMSPEYIRAFEDLKNTSSETLEFLLGEFERVKESAAGSLNPQDLQAYVNAMEAITSELQERDPFKVIKNGYKELETASKTLQAAQRELNKIRNSGGQGTDAEQKAIKAVNKAKDDYIKKNREVKKAEKEVQSAVKDLCNGLQDIGDAVGGQAGEIISLIGQVGTFTMSAIEGFQTASEASSKAIQTVEKASVILGIISTAMQVVTKIASIFTGDDGTAAYEKAEEAYKNYINILDDVIDKQKELIASMSGENAANSFKYAISLIEQESDAARELGKQYLNAGASKGYFGIGSKSSHGVGQRKGISGEGWNQFNKVAVENGINTSVADGRMTGLFDLSAKQLEKLRTEAPVFWAQLHDDTRTYLKQIISATKKTEEMKDTLNKSLTGITFDSMKDTFLDDLSDMETSADEKSKKIGESITDNMRKALINNMFKSQFQDQLNKWYQMWSDAMNPDGDGGENITSAEQSALDSLKNSIIQGATAAADKINDQFRTGEDEADDTLTGAVKGVSEETASMIGGQMNAMRINQLEASELLRQQLTMLTQIVSNTAYNHYLQSIDERLSKMQDSDSLRSQGITY